MSGTVNNALNRFSLLMLFVMYQSPRMYFVLLGITYLNQLLVEKYPARGRVVVDVVMPGVQAE